MSEEESDDTEARLSTGVVALVPCRNGGSALSTTVKALRVSPEIDRVVVIDDGSSDDTAMRAYNAGATVVRLERNQGKAGAMKAGVEATPEAEIYLFVDADTGDSASKAVALLAPVMNDEADMTIAVLPSAGGKGGFGIVRDFAAWGIHRGAHARVKAPLSGQRAVKAPELRALIAKSDLAPRFGVEVGLTIDALNAGWRVAEVDVDMTHRHRGRGVDGFAHRGNQGKDILRALWYRALPLWVRVMPLAFVTALLLVVCGIAAQMHQTPEGKALVAAPDVDVVLVPGAEWESTRADETTEALASVVTGNTDNAYAAVASGSRNKDAPASSDINISTAAGVPIAVTKPTLVVGVTVKGQTAALRPLLLMGAKQTGALVSSSTDRTGLVDITDIAPTVLQMEGKPIPDTMTGSPITVARSLATPDELSAVDQMARFYDRINPRVIVTYVLFQVAAFLWALWVARKDRELAGARWVAAGVAGFPLATFATRWVLGAGNLSAYVWTGLMAVFTAGIVYAANLKAKDSLSPLRRILLATIVFIGADVVFGGALQLSGTFGSSPTLGARYHGLGNPASELLLLATVLWSGLHVQIAPVKADAMWASTAMLLVVTVIVGAPGLGSDVGGLLAMVVTSVGLLAAFQFGRLSWRWLAGAGGSALVALLIAAFIDYQRAPDARTHLGRLLARVIKDGPSPLFDTIRRKIDANVLAYGFPWSLGVVAIVGFVLIALMRGSWSGAFPLRSPQRFAFIAAVAGSFVAYAVNDSGIVVLALIAVFVGPYVLVEYRHKRSSQLEVVVP